MKWYRPVLRPAKNLLAHVFSGSIRWLAVWGGCAAACWLPNQAAAAPAEQLAALADQYVERTFELDPMMATWAGERKYADRFVDRLTPEFRARDLALQEETLAALSRIDAAALLLEDRLTYDVLKYRAAMRREALRLDFHLTPLSQFHSVPLMLLQFASTEGPQPFRSVADYDAFLRRMKGLPRWVDSAIANMREGMAKNVVQPKAVMRRVLAQLKAQLVDDPARSGFYVPVHKFPATFSDADRNRLTVAYREMVMKQTIPAFARLHEFVEKEYLHRCRDSAGLAGTPNGLDKYAHLVRSSTTTELTPDAIHQTGLSEVARIRGEMERLRRQVAFKGDLAAFLGSIATDPRHAPFGSEEEVIEAYLAIQRRVEPRLERLFLRKPLAALEVRPEPEKTRAIAAPHYEVGARDGSRPGVFFVPVRDAATYTSLKMTSLFLHEGLPGHHFESSLAQESALTRFRSMTEFEAYAEGWGLYAESLGGEMGLYDDPYQLLGRLLGEMRRAIRLVVDTGMHAMHWTREQGAAYLIENEGGSGEEAMQEIERCVAFPGQALSYKIGELKIMALRASAQQKLGPRFDLREFHDEMLKDGDLPLAVLEDKMNRWMAAR